MTLGFSCSGVPRNDVAMVVGCGQVRVEPANWSEWDGKLTRCGRCRSPLFPIEGEREVKCPVCEPNSAFSKSVFGFGEKREQKELFVLVFDLALPRNTLYLLLNELCGAIHDGQRVCLVALSNNVVFAAVSQGMLAFYSVSSYAEVGAIGEYAMSKESLKEVAIPAFDSIYSLYPPEMSSVVNPFLGLEMVLAAAGKRSCVVMCFLCRQAVALTVSDAEKLGEKFASSRSVVHFCVSDEFRKYTAVARHCFGRVISVSFLPQGILTRLVELSVSIVSLEISAPRSVEFVKVIGCTGKMNLSANLSRLELTNMVAGAFEFTYDSERCSEEKVNFVVLLETSHRSYLYLYQLPVLDAVTFSSDLVNRIQMKKYAKEILEYVWKGGNMEVILKKKFTKEVQSLVAGTSLVDLGRHLQRDVMQLYYFLNSFTDWPLSKRIIDSPQGYKLMFVPPTVFILADKDTISKVDLQHITPYLYECRVITDIHAFKLLAQQHGMELEPPSPC